MARIAWFAALILLAPLTASGTGASTGASPGPRALALLDAMSPGPLKTRLEQCRDSSLTPRRFSIGHRGAPARYAEHSADSYRAGARQGAGVIECDVTFTRDLELVCRHSQDDLARTTNILETPLAATCAARPVGATWRQPGNARCATAALTLAELKSLEARMDSRGPHRAVPASGSTARIVEHRESIRLIDAFGRDFTPELKRPAVSMPFAGMTREMYAQRLIDDYKALGIAPERVWPQSFDLADIRYWIANEPAFGRQAVYLDGRYRQAGFDPAKPERLQPDMAALKASGVNLLAPPLWVLLTLDDGRIVPSAYARAARAAGLELFTWTMERSGSLSGGGGWYFQTIKDAVRSDGAFYRVLHVLANDVGVHGVFSDWPEPVTFYANCMGLP